MLRAAAEVLVGAGALHGGAGAEGGPQVLESPAVPPAELMQAERTSARVLICWTGAMPPVGSDGPGTAPEEGSTREVARVKAEESAAASRDDEPMAEAEVM